MPQTGCVTTDHRARVALVLGAGGVVGHAFHVGVLSALADELDWDARCVQLVVGTSAGSVVAASLRAGLSPADLRRRLTGEPLSPEGTALMDRAQAALNAIDIPDERVDANADGDDDATPTPTPTRPRSGRSGRSHVACESRRRSASGGPSASHGG